MIKKEFVMKSLQTISFIVFIGILFVQPSVASNLNFLNFSAMNFFHGNDMQLMQANTYRALNQVKDGKKASWSNPDTGSFGYAMPSNTSRVNGRTCRNLKIANTAQKVSGAATYRFCKINNEWKIV